MTSLTPAEELGLSGLSLDSRVRRAFYTIGAPRMSELIRRMSEEASRRKLTYWRAGQVETIRMLLRPIAVMPEQMAYLNYVSLTILNALKRLPELYLGDANVREIVRLTAPEHEWLLEHWQPSHRENNPVFGRLDAVVDFTSPMWKESLRFMEPNLCGVGGVHLGPTCEHLLVDLVVPVLQSLDPQLRMEAGQDLRELFIQEILDHCDAIGRRGRHLCFIEPKYAVEGIDEQEPLAEYYHQRHGLNVLHADPTELVVRDGDVWYEDHPVDIAYRDYEVRDLLELETTLGHRLEAVRMLFKQNRMVSSLAGDFDHKSCWELLTDARLTEKYFNAEERQVFRRHILWTRVVSARNTVLPDGTPGDLLDCIRKDQEILVMKPNRSYGGDRVLLGHSVSEAEWEAVVQQALVDEGSWVVQRLASIPVNEFPVVAPDGSVDVEPFYTVMGFSPTKYGLSIIGRASQKEVVNVAQRGGLCGVLIGRPPSGLVGP
jgi:hypothetical protein